MVFIKEPITEEVANQNIALSLYLDSVDNKRLYYWLNVPGGEVRTAWARGGVLGLGDVGCGDEGVSAMG